jgi:alanine dehydrogenase
MHKIDNPMSISVGIIKEEKTPSDQRVPLRPEQVLRLLERPFVETIKIQRDPRRCFSDEEYQKQGLSVVDDVSDCDVLMGVKEVPIDELIPNKTYFFCSHTIKEQAYNRALLQAVLDKNIRLIDYEVLTNERGQRLIAFGRFAGMVGAHNAIWTYEQRQGITTLPRLHEMKDYEAAQAVYTERQLPPVKIVVTGGGRVAQGAVDVLKDMGAHQVDPNTFLSIETNRAIFTQLDCGDYAKRKDGGPFDLQDFFQHPENYKSTFAPYTAAADIFINGIYWDPKAPKFFSPEDTKTDRWNIQVIADVTCDIAPDSSVPSTLRPSTISDPVYGYDPKTGEETKPFKPEGIDVMAVDNLPNELPRDASTSFGEQFLTSIADELAKPESAILQRATIAENGKLGAHFSYLDDFVKG